MSGINLSRKHPQEWTRVNSEVEHNANFDSRGPHAPQDYSNRAAP